MGVLDPAVPLPRVLRDAMPSRRHDPLVFGPEQPYDTEMPPWRTLPPVATLRRCCGVRGNGPSCWCCGRPWGAPRW